MSLNVFCAGVKPVHLPMKKDTGEDPGAISFCRQDCSHLLLVSLPLDHLELACPDCNKQVKLLKAMLNS